MSRPNSPPKKRSQVNCAGKILCFNFHKNNKNTFADFSKSKNIKKTAAGFVLGHNKGAF